MDREWWAVLGSSGWRRVEINREDGAEVEVKQRENGAVWRPGGQARAAPHAIPFADMQGWRRTLVAVRRFDTDVGKGGKENCQGIFRCV